MLVDADCDTCRQRRWHVLNRYLYGDGTGVCASNGLGTCVLRPEACDNRPTTVTQYLPRRR